jgi:hypothetical protein
MNASWILDERILHFSSYPPVDDANRFVQETPRP